jgi:hypothetical protein
MNRRSKVQVEAQIVESLHPEMFVAEFCQGHPEIEALEFGIYKYVPQTDKDQRLLKKVAPNNIQARYQELERNLEPGQEIALHSRVYLRKGPSPGRETCIRHIPMIDFKGKVGLSDLERVAEIAVDFHCHEMAAYFSGRSFHFYGFTLLTHEEWIRFMGRVLLLNLPGRPALVDARWVGHRLLAGYSSLRWSQNTEHYTQSPEIRYFRSPNSSDWNRVKSAPKNQFSNNGKVERLMKLKEEGSLVEA